LPEVLLPVPDPITTKPKASGLIAFITLLLKLSSLSFCLIEGEIRRVIKSIASLYFIVEDLVNSLANSS
jgi:hypothetical protein